MPVVVVVELQMQVFNLFNENYFFGFSLLCWNKSIGTFVLEEEFLVGGQLGERFRHLRTLTVNLCDHLHVVWILFRLLSEEWDLQTK